MTSKRLPAAAFMQGLPQVKEKPGILLKNRFMVLDRDRERDRLG
jgi:hypothetical protein